MPHLLDRRAFVLSAGVAAGCATAAPRASGARSSTFVLVHGAWVGGWCWRDVAERLRADGHTVYAPSLTGLADRSHLASPAIDLDTHVKDIANLIAWEELSDIVLVGHSYAGQVVSGVTEALPEGTIRSIVYLDAFLPEDGESVVDQSPGLRELAGDAAFVPILPADFWGYPPDVGARVDRLSTPHPSRTWFDGLRLTGARERIAKKTFVLATENLDEDGAPVFQSAYDTTGSRGDWRTETLACPHDVMLFLPEQTADVLRRAAV